VQNPSLHLNPARAPLTRVGRVQLYAMRDKPKTNMIPAAAGSAPSMQLLVFYPLACACGAGKVFPRCAPLLWREFIGELPYML